MRHADVVLLAPLLGLFDCGPIVVPASTTTPSNSCAASSDCASYCPAKAVVPCMASDLTCEETLSGPACVSSSQKGLTAADLVLLIDIPTDSTFVDGQGLTFALQSNDIACANLPKSTCASDGVTGACMASLDGKNACVQLTNAVLATGAYVVAGMPAGERFGGLDFKAALTSLPVRATFIPTWPPCTTSVFEKNGCAAQTVAASLNLPLPNVVALTTWPGSTSMGSVLVNAPPGPGSSGPIAWTTFLPASPVGSYYLSVAPVAPYDQFIPPLDYNAPIGTVIAETAPGGRTGPPPIAVNLFGEDPTGWTVYIREEHPPQRIVSNVASIQTNGMTDSVTLYTFPSSATPPPELQVVASPPPGKVLPQLIQGNGLDGITYRPVPPAVTVSGVVLDAGGASMDGTLHFVGTELLDVSAAGDCSTEDHLDLAYEAFVPTSAGAFNVSLPQGIYSVTIDPGPSSNAAKTTLLSQSFRLEGAACLQKNMQIEAVHLRAANPALLRGTVTIADGRPLGNVEVDINPSGLLLQQTSPTGGLVLAETDWPRATSTITHADGSFSVPVDPIPYDFATYDVSVRPMAETRLPWIVYPGVVVTTAASQSALALVVPAPTVLGPLTIHDSNDVGVAQAVVRAYAFTSSTGPAAQIGEALTDGAGTFEMFLTPVPFPVAAVKP
jgi:hypothetical protein